MEEYNRLKKLGENEQGQEIMARRKPVDKQTSGDNEVRAVVLTITLKISEISKMLCKMIGGHFLQLWIR